MSGEHNTGASASQTGLAGAETPEPHSGLGPSGDIPSADTFGIAGYTHKGRFAQTQVIFHHPDGESSLTFETITKNGVDGVIIDWFGNGVIALPSERIAALATLLSPENFVRTAIAAGARSAEMGETPAQSEGRQSGGEAASPEA